MVLNTGQAYQTFFYKTLNWKDVVSAPDYKIIE